MLRNSPLLAFKWGRASSDLRLNPHFHTLFLDGVYLPSQASVALDWEAPTFTAAPTPTQEDVESVVQRARKRILRYLEKRGVVTFAAAPGDGEVNAVLDETLGESSPLLAGLLAAATAGVAPAGPAQRSKPIRLMASTNMRPEPKGYLCARYFTGQVGGFNLHAARRVAPNDKQGREMLCRYILRPPMANERLHLLADGRVELEFKRPWKDGRVARHSRVAVQLHAPCLVYRSGSEGLLGKALSDSTSAAPAYHSVLRCTFIT